MHAPVPKVVEADRKEAAVVRRSAEDEKVLDGPGGQSEALKLFDGSRIHASEERKKCGETNSNGIWEGRETQ